MIKKLRIKFIIVALSSVVLVLSVIIGGINIHNYNDVNRRTDETLLMLKNNNGKFSDKPKEPGVDDIPQKEIKDNISPETPFETRYFTVKVDSEGNSELITKEVVAIDEATAIKYANEVLKLNKEKGFKENYKYLKFKIDDADMIIFVDCTRDLNTFHEFLNTSIIISTVGIIVVFILVVIFSLIITKPFVENYKKQKRFITDASHELKTPLTIINASCEILEYTSGETEWTKNIKDQVTRLTELTNKLVFLTKMDEENSKITMTEFSLSEVIDEVVKQYIPVFKANNKNYDVNITPNITYKGDMRLIKEMMELLIDNAVKYSDEPGNIKIKLYLAGKCKKIIISNTTKEKLSGNLDNLFERFYRPDSSRNSETGGHGIGLSVVKAIVTQHKGKINACLTSDNTVSFNITL